MSSTCSSPRVWAAVARGARPDDPWLAVMRRLAGLRLVVASEREPRLGRVHRVVRDVVAARMGAEAAGQRLAAVMEVAEGRAKFLWEGWVDREARWEIEPVHQLALERMRAGDLQGANVAGRIWSPLQDLGRLPEARRLLARAIEIDEKAYDADHPTLAVRYWNLSQVEQPLGHLAEALALARRAHAIWHARLGDAHPHTQLVHGWLAANDPDWPPS